MPRIFSVVLSIASLRLWLGFKVTGCHVNITEALPEHFPGILTSQLLPLRAFKGELFFAAHGIASCGDLT